MTNNDLLEQFKSDRLGTINKIMAHDSLDRPESALKQARKAQLVLNLMNIERTEKDD